MPDVQWYEIKSGKEPTRVISFVNARKKRTIMQNTQRFMWKNSNKGNNTEEEGNYFTMRGVNELQDRVRSFFLSETTSYEVEDDESPLTLSLSLPPNYGSRFFSQMQRNSSLCVYE